MQSRDKMRRTGLAVHALKSVYKVDWEAARIRMRKEHWTKSKVLESILIVESNDTTNLDARLNLNPVWRSLFRTHSPIKIHLRTIPAS